MMDFHGFSIAMLEYHMVYSRFLTVGILFVTSSWDFSKLDLEALKVCFLRFEK